MTKRDQARIKELEAALDAREQKISGLKQEIKALKEKNTRWELLIGYLTRLMGTHDNYLGYDPLFPYVLSKTFMADLVLKDYDTIMANEEAEVAEARISGDVYTAKKRGWWKW